MKTKAQGLPMNTMILAVLGIAVLVVLILMFTKGSGIFSKQAFSCDSKGGSCVEKGKCDYQTADFTCGDKKQPVCCINPAGG